VSVTHTITVWYPGFTTNPNEFEEFKGVESFDTENGILSFEWRGAYITLSGMPFRVTSLPSAYIYRRQRREAESPKEGT
jgi:hypothetical protein